MTAVRFLFGVALMAVALGPVAAGAWALRRRLLGWVGAPARVAEVVLGASTVVVVTELLGLVDLYRVGPVVLGLAAVGGAQWWWARSQVAGHDPAEPDADDGPGPAIPRSVMGRWGTILAVVAVGVLVADWAPRVVDAYHHGMPTIDTLWYHMPMAARWVQTGSIRHVQYFDGDAVTAFYPGNSELFHGFGIMTLGSDVLSPGMNVLWLALALVSAWSIGRRADLAPLTVTGAAALFAIPSLVGTQPGGAYTDVVSMALLLATFAILVEAHRREAPTLAGYLVAALAAGLALGTKFTMLVPVAALSVGVVVTAPRGRRVRHAEAWLVGLGVTGFFWYFRNIVAVGNPLPALGAKLGPVAIRNLSNETGQISSVSHYVFNGPVWRAYLIPGLDRSLGWGWWSMLALAIAGMVLAALIGPTRAHRLLGVVGGASLVGYLFTQQILGPAGAPIYFGVNVRYIAPSVLLGLVALSSAAVRWPVLRPWILGLFLLLLAGLQLDPTTWPSHLLSLSFVAPIRGIDSLLGALVGVAVLVGGVALVCNRDRLDRLDLSPPVVVGAIALVVVIVGAVLAPVYHRGRYAHDASTATAWATHLHDRRIGTYGSYGILQFPMYGGDLSNHVQYLGVAAPDGSFGAIPDCATWRTVVDAGHYDYLFLTKLGAKPPPDWGWTSQDPAARHIPNPDEPNAAIFKLTGPLDPSACPAS